MSPVVVLPSRDPPGCWFLECAANGIAAHTRKKREDGCPLFGVIATKAASKAYPIPGRVGHNVNLDYEMGNIPVHFHRGSAVPILW